MTTSPTTRYKNRASAPGHLRTKTELKAIRLRLPDGAHPSCQYWQGQGYVALYDPEKAVPMRPARPVTEKQRQALAAGRGLAGTVLCNACQERVDRDTVVRHGVCQSCRYRQWDESQQELLDDIQARVREALAMQCLFLDTETTGLDAGSQVVEIAILDTDGGVLLDTLVKPSSPIPPDAEAIHGISNAMVEQSPSWASIGPVVGQILRGRVVVAHNADFDRRIMEQSDEAHRVVSTTAGEFVCSMEMMTPLNGGRWPSLQVAAAIANVGPGALPGQAHRALGDAHRCRAAFIGLIAKDFGVK